MLLDTAFLIDLMRGEASAIDRLKALENEGISQNVASPTLYELYVGIMLSKKPEAEKRKVLEVLTSATILNLDAKSAEMAGRIQGGLIAKGKMLDPEDTMIAGIAITHGETVLTRNVEHLSRIYDLKLETY